MKQLIEEQLSQFEKQKEVYMTNLRAYYHAQWNGTEEEKEVYRIEAEKSRNVLNEWYVASLKQFIDELIAWNEARITYEDYDVMVCKKCKSVIRRRTSHHSEDGFSECCGSKLERLNGKNKEFTPENDAVEFGIAHLKKLKEELN